MNNLKRWPLALLSLATTLHAAVPQRDGGGRDVSIAMFSTRTLHAVTLMAIGPNSWTARCAHCEHKPLTQPMQITWLSDIFAGGTLRVTDDGSGDSRTATGLWHLRGSERQHDLDVILTLPSERYVAAVLNAEAAPTEPAQSLRSLAIVARTYALNGARSTAQPGHLGANVCDSTECQAMLLGAAGASIEEAVQDTAGETLWFGNTHAQVFFSQSCGGLTEDAGAVWPTLRGIPYLRSHADPFCLRRDSTVWHADIPLKQFLDIVKSEGWRIPSDPIAARVTRRSQSRRALRVAFIGPNGIIGEVSASSLRFGISRALGWNLVRSDAYDVALRNGELIFDGRGHGHGVGLCQEGAAEMAAEGKNAREILAFYFPGTTVRVLPGDLGWQQEQIGPLTLRTTAPLTATQEHTVSQTWNEARRRFPPRHALAPEIVFAPTTELFRQMTAQPGWALASTRGSTIVLQPATILHGPWRDASTTLLHEMLHVLVEGESNERTPLWLREGFVEVLSSDRSGTQEAIPESTMSVKAIESALARAESLSDSERAHIAAAARVHALISRYGISAVRGWLASGVPAGIT